MSNDTDYDYSRYEKLVTNIVEDRCYNPNNIRGCDISDTTGVKLIFDGYAENDDGDDDTNHQCYVLFIHKDSGPLNFEFPEHDIEYGMIVHRPDKEIDIYIWHDVKNNEYDVVQMDEDNKVMTPKKVMEILETIYENNYAEYEYEED